jgi:tetratricopeptide (TPR) repeat protein
MHANAHNRFNGEGFLHERVATKIIYLTALTAFLLLMLAGCTAPAGPTSGVASTSDIQSGVSLADEEILRYRQAITYLNENQLDRAEEIFSSFINKRPELSGPRVNLALVLIRRNNLPKAQETLHQALQLNPQMPQALNLLGYIEKKNGNINKAKEHLTQALVVKSDYAIAHYNIALLYDIYFQDIRNAIKHYKQYLDLIGAEDQDTANWVNELERSLSRG